MGNTQSTAAFGDRLSLVGPNTITNPSTPLLLLAAPSVDTQPWRIHGTLSADEEERQINRLVERGSKNGEAPKHVVYYGLNSTDTSPETQARKLANHGLEASVYRGGLFEWVLLREAFGDTVYRLSNIGNGNGESETINPLDFLPKH